MAKKAATGNGVDKQSEKRNNPLFYINPMPLDKNKHKNLSLQDNVDLKFTKNVNAVPVNMIELPQVCHFYPVAFSPSEDATPVAILGLRDGENLFVDKDGKWEEGTYIPAYIRRYPFIFSEIPGTSQLTLCVDNNKDFVVDGGSKKFFDGEEPSELSKNAMEFCKSYHSAALQTKEFGNALSSAGLLVEKQAQIQVAGDTKINFSGFRVVDEKKLAELPDKTFLEWREKGWLPFIYAHLFSGAQWQNLSRRLNSIIKAKAA